MESTNDYGMLFERTIIAYWGWPKTSVYFASYFHDSFKMNALLFSIIVYELNYNFNDYSPIEIKQLKKYQLKGWDNSITLNDSYKILEVLAKHKNIS